MKKRHPLWNLSGLFYQGVDWPPIPAVWQPGPLWVFPSTEQGLLSPWRSRLQVRAVSVISESDGTVSSKGWTFKLDGIGHPPGSSVGFHGLCSDDERCCRACSREALSQGFEDKENLCHARQRCEQEGSGLARGQTDVEREILSAPAKRCSIWGILFPLYSADWVRGHSGDVQRRTEEVLVWTPAPAPLCGRDQRKALPR